MHIMSTCIITHTLSGYYTSTVDGRKLTSTKCGYVQWHDRDVKIYKNLVSVKSFQIGRNTQTSPNHQHTVQQPTPSTAKIHTKHLPTMTNALGTK